MSYKESLQRLLDAIEKCESIAQISKTIDPIYTMNEAIKGLDAGSWKIGITDKYRWSVSSTDNNEANVYEQVGIGSFEAFRNSLVASVTKHLKEEARNYEHIKDFREKAVALAIAVVNNLTEDIYEDAMFEYRKGKDHEKIVAGIKQRKEKLFNYAESVAEEWVRENIAPGIKVFYDSPYVHSPEGLTIDKVTRVGNSTLITFKDTDMTSENFESIDFLETWLQNEDSARGICDRISSISYLQV